MVSAEPVVALLAGAVSAIALGMVALWLANRLRLVAIPNERSSHTLPTPSIGGVCFVVPMLIWLLTSDVPQALPIAVTCGGLAALGLLDEFRELSARLKLPIQLGLVGTAVVWLWPEQSLLWQLIVGFCLLWFVNLFNFMDGIDGIAGIEGLVYLVGVAVLTGAMLSWWETTLWLGAGGLLGFLVFNWPPARMFMGDVGSLFLGLWLGLMAIQLDQMGHLPLVGSILLLAVFWFDATYTLCVRIVSGQRIAQAHKSHLYQRLAARYGHRSATVTSGLYGLLWLWPLAWVATRNDTAVAIQVMCVAAAIMPMAIASWRWRAGWPGTGS